MLVQVNFNYKSGQKENKKNILFLFPAGEFRVLSAPTLVILLHPALTRLKFNKINSFPS